jgi:lipooligosaccharide transport system ATP-binding protein
MSTHYIEEAERSPTTSPSCTPAGSSPSGRPGDLVREHVGSRVLEVYGPPPRLLEVEQVARDAGCRPAHRAGRGGPARRGRRRRARRRLPDAVVRPANLEDVFVLLTGEKVD